jgi:S-adenosylmethionine decarboxylase
MCGTHIIADVYDINNDTFKLVAHDNYQSFHQSILTLLKTHNMTYVNHNIKIFDNLEGAFTSLYLLEESHLSFHSWPENNYIAIDVFTCGSCDTVSLMNNIIKLFDSNNTDIYIINRGKKNKIKEQ